MAKLDPLASLTSTYGAVSALNANFQKLATALANTVSLDGSGPNLMQASLDLNHFNVRNVAAGVNAADAVNLSQLIGLFGSIPAGKPGPATYAQPQDYGALGITNSLGALVDETVAIQAMIDSAYNGGSTLPGLPGGGIVELGQKKSYYVNQTLQLRPYLTLMGRGMGRDEILGYSNGNNLDKSRINYGSIPGTLILGPNGKINRYDHSGPVNLAVVSLPAAQFMSTQGQPMTVPQVQTLLSSYSSYPLAIDTAPGACGVFADNCFIAGFQLGIKQTYNERWRVSWCKFDCINDFYATQTYDDSRYFANHSWPFVWGHRFADGVPGVSDLLSYYGVGTKFDKGIDPSRSIDAGHVSLCFFYGKMLAIDLGDTNGLHVSDVWIDGDVSRADTLNTIGIRTSGNCRRTKLTNIHIDSQGRGFDLQGSGVILSNNTTAGCTASHIRMGPGVMAQINGHLFQGASPLYVELDPGIGRVQASGIMWSYCNGIAIGLAGGATVPASTRKNFKLRNYEVENPQAGFTFYFEQWRSVAQVQNASAQTVTSGSYQKVVLGPLSSPVDGYGEFNNNSFTAAYDGLYLVTGTIGVQPTATPTAGQAISTEVRINGIEQPQSRFQINPSAQALYGCPVSGVYLLRAGQVIDLWVYSDMPTTLTTGKSSVTIVRMAD